MRNVETNLSSGKWIMWFFFDVLSHFMLFCCKISLLCDLRCFVAIHALWRGEKLSKKFYLWRKKDKYEVWVCLLVSGNVLRCFQLVCHNCCSREESISKVIFVEKSEINFILAVLERDYRKCMHQRILNWIKFSWYGQYNPTFNKGCAAHCAHCAWCWTNILHIGKGQMENIAGGLTLYFQVAIFCCHDFHQEPHVVKKSTTSVK